MKRILAIFVTLAALTACLDIDPFLYRCLTMGFVKDDGSFRADDGRIYTFTDFMPEWKSGDRVVVIMDVTSAVNDSVYKATNVSYVYPLFKKPVVVNAGSSEPDTLGVDDIRMIDGWYAGGYLNMSAQIKMVDGKGPEIVNLMVDNSTAPSVDTLRLVLRHRSDHELQPGEVRSDYSFYASFPIREYIAAKDSVVLKISWKWEGQAGSTAAKVEK